MVAAAQTHSAEVAVQQFLTTKQAKGTVDVRHIPFWQIRFIDCLLRELTTVKLQTNVLHDGSLFFECQRDHGLSGNFYRSRADVWVCVDPETGTGYRFRLSEAQAWLADHAQPEWLTTTCIHRKDAVVSYVGYKVPLVAFRAGVKTKIIKKPAA